MLLVISVIAHYWGEAGVKEWGPHIEGPAPSLRTSPTGPTPKWSREFSTLDESPWAGAGSSRWIDAGGGSKPLGMFSRQMPLLVVPSQL